MKILNSKTKNFDKNLDYLLFKRRKSIKSDKVSVTNIINDVKILKLRKQSTQPIIEFTNFILYKNLRIFRIQINLKTNLNINIYH